MIFAAVRRRDRQPPLPLDVTDQPSRELQVRDIDVQIHPVDGFAVIVSQNVRIGLQEESTIGAGLTVDDSLDRRVKAVLMFLDDRTSV